MQIKLIAVVVAATACASHPQSVARQPATTETVVSWCSGGVDACNGDPDCETCIDAGGCADGPDPMWTGTACVCLGTVYPWANCELPWCCASGSHWDTTVCTCVPDGSVSQCEGGLEACGGNPDCEACIDAGGCASGPDPVWNGNACVCAGFPQAWANCELPFCCSSTAHWDPAACACVVN